MVTDDGVDDDSDSVSCSNDYNMEAVITVILWFVVTQLAKRV